MSKDLTPAQKKAKKIKRENIRKKHIHKKEKEKSQYERLRDLSFPLSDSKFDKQPV